MLFVGLVHSREWEPPEELPEPRPQPSWRVPWRVLAWVAAWWTLMALVPVAERALGPVAGYVSLMLVLALGVWRVERWCARQYWRGLRDFQA